MASTAYDFTLEIRGADIFDDEVIDALYEAGCDDALIGQFMGVDRLDFDREARSYCEAVRTAIEDVESVPGVSVSRVLAGDDPTAGVAFTVAVNAVLAAPAECPRVAGADEQIELSRIWELTARVPSASASGQSVAAAAKPAV